ncbi:M1 family metallopeptidase [Fodinibius sp.]|uniref:M1 family metallopeptidase n=1 Tax=Fodinibius sp. TaxID=1872440 RepID=UPI002ACEA9E1|nr:M1 family metallopeptidase [Fodinibius sp.]MDZ7658850.1 M1 family metallopeptidase [Fodinibius sp.]
MFKPLLSFRNVLLPVVFAAYLFVGCTGTQQTTEESQTTTQEKTVQPPSELDRLVPNPITEEIPNAFFNAIENDTRTMSGEPGKNYWTQWTNYDIDVELLPADTLVKGNAKITYYNNSPDTLNALYMELAQNLHAKGAQRSSPQEVTGGINLHNVGLNGDKLSQMQSRRDPSGYGVNGTLLFIRPKNAVAPGDSAKIEISWDFKVPRRGASGRMGYSEDNLFYIAYWYPQMRVYDDVVGWMTDQFTGTAEFYHDFADYNVDITVPDQWMVGSTGQLKNGKDVLAEDIYQRLNKAHNSDTVMSVVTEDDFGSVTKSPESGTLTWNFKAHKVRDFAFSVTKESKWDATRASVGDLDGDGDEEYTHINAIYRSSAPKWTDGAKFTQHAITFLSEQTGLEYPWPHMTSVEGGGIIGGGMEFPMMTIIGDYNNQSSQALYAVIAHELAHMWVPMIVSTNERHYAWMDEGTTTYNENQAKKAYYPEGPDYDLNDMKSYLQITNTDAEGPIMRWSNHHYNGFAYGIASYPKPASMLVSLRSLLGEKTFNKALHEFIDRWKYKHPYPWDMFNTFEDVAGRDLDWFWRAWYYETWTLDQAVGNVSIQDGTTRITIEDHGQAPMPANVEITKNDGSTMTRTIPVDTWLEGATQAVITVDGDVTNVVIDPNKNYPDTNRKNNSWQK